MAPSNAVKDGAASPRLVVVAGSGRSGTSTIAGVLKALGLFIPQPEVAGNQANPSGHFEPRWVVDLQKRLLREAHIKLSDARPDAFAVSGQLGLRPKVQKRVRQWLGTQVGAAPEIVVKDPRNSWFLPMWREAAEALSVSPNFLTMLRHPAEVVGSKNTYYYKRETAERRRIGETSRVAGWVNVALFTEYSTRDSSRSFVRYGDLLSDWRAVIASTAETLDLSLRHGLSGDLAEKVDSFIDPSLHRVKVTWDDFDIPMALEELAENVWHQLNRLAEVSGHDGEAEAALDEARLHYRQMYDDAHALASSSVDAAVRSAVRKATKKAQSSPSSDTAASQREPVADASPLPAFSPSRRVPDQGEAQQGRLKRKFEN